MAAVASVTPSSNVYVNALLGGYKWASGSLTYSFPASYSYYESSYGSNEPSRNFEALNTTQQGVVQAAFANFAAVANVTFSELTGANAANATLRLAMSDAPGTAWAYMPSTGAAGGDSWYNNTSGVYDNPKKGNYAYATFLHEIGHALGLEHPHENAMPVSGDGMEFTVMSYRAFEGAPLTGYTNESWGFAQSLMMYDIAAMQHLYGANFSTNSGNTTYSWSPTTGQAFINGVGQPAPGSNRIFQTLWDGGGTDTYDFSNYSNDLDVDLRPGHWTTVSSPQRAELDKNGRHVAQGNIANALQYNEDGRSLVENAVGGSGSDRIMGNFANNLLIGRGGSDTMTGGLGDDVYEVTDAGDMVIERANEGYDWVATNLNYTLGADIEGLSLFGAVNGTGNALDNQLVGSAQSNVLIGRGGSDTMTGGLGDDVYEVTDAGDMVIERANEGYDWVATNLNYTLGADIEGLSLFGAVNGTGNALDNQLVGSAQSNVLIGRGGSDTMTGGLGDDVYEVTDAGDMVIERANEGYDWVATNLNYTLGADIEGLSLFGAVNGTGNALDNQLVGSAQSNVLIGRGGSDTMTGGLGDDVYEVTDAGDMVIERANEGYDWVATNLNYTLGADIEGLSLFGAVNGTGNALDNQLVGSAQSNVLIGRGGSDTMTGGLGDDIFQFYKGDGGGDFILDFSRTEGDRLLFIGYSANAAFQPIAPSIWNIVDGGLVDVFYLSNSAIVSPADYFFI